jgi:hypothetical protein
LIKGLEFEHALILDKSDDDAKNFYVTVTRPTKSLTICSRMRAIRPRYGAMSRRNAAPKMGREGGPTWTK